LQLDLVFEVLFNSVRDMLDLFADWSVFFSN